MLPSISRICIYLLIASTSFGREPELMHTIKSNKGTNNIVLFSPDSKILATSNYHEVGLWDVNSAKNICILINHSPYCITSLALSPDGKILAGGAQCGRFHLWDMNIKKEIASITTNDGTYYGSTSSVAFTPDGKSILSWNCDARGDEQSITFWDAVTRKNTGKVKLQSRKYGFLVFSPDCKNAAGSVNSDEISTGEIIDLFDTSTGKIFATLNEGHGFNFAEMAFSPDGNIFAAAFSVFPIRDETTGTTVDLPGPIELWDVKTGNNILTFHGDEHDGYISSLAFSPDGKILASGDWDYPFIKIWDISSGKIIVTIKRQQQKHEGIMSLSFSPNGKMLASGLSNGTIDIWNIQGIAITDKSSLSTDKALDSRSTKQTEK